MFKGMLAEQFVGQELLSALDNDLFYWAREAKSSTAEVDFLVEQGGQVYPIEVKSGPKGPPQKPALAFGQLPSNKKGLHRFKQRFWRNTGTKIGICPFVLCLWVISE
jgi:predicted AAA+ superfamily ATPase